MPYKWINLGRHLKCEWEEFKPVQFTPVALDSWYIGAQVGVVSFISRVALPLHYRKLSPLSITEKQVQFSWNQPANRNLSKGGVPQIVISDWES